MDNWDDNNEFDYGSSTSAMKRANNGWFWPLTILAMVLVGGLSMLMSWLTKDVANRSIWLMGLIFMIPAGTMFVSAMLLEFSTGAMTPATSRSTQVRVVIIFMILTFLVGCVVDAIYLYGGYFRDSSVNYVFMVDRGDTLEQQKYNGKTSGTIADDVFTELMTAMPENTNAGMIVFDRHVLASVEIGRLNQERRYRMSEAIKTIGQQGVAFVEPIQAAIDMAKAFNNERLTYIIVISTGIEAKYVVSADGNLINEIINTSHKSETLQYDKSYNDLLNNCKEANVKLYAVTPNGQADQKLINFATDAGGSVVAAADASGLEEFKVLITAYDGDMIRADTPSSVVFASIMLVLEGLVIGVGLTLLLSVNGQKRFQPILSLLMGVAAAVVLKFIFLGNVTWQMEGACFALFGIVFMCRNNGAYVRRNNFNTMESDVGDTQEEW